MASKLSKNPEIMARISDIKTEVRADTNTTIHSIIDELEDARQKAKQANNPHLMMRASMLKAELLGFVGDDTSPNLGPGLELKFGFTDLKALKAQMDKEDDER